TDRVSCLFLRGSTLLSRVLGRRWRGPTVEGVTHAFLQGFSHGLPHGPFHLVLRVVRREHLLDGAARLALELLPACNETHRERQDYSHAPSNAFLHCARQGLLNSLRSATTWLATRRDALPTPCFAPVFSFSIPASSLSHVHACQTRRVSKRGQDPG